MTMNTTTDTTADDFIDMESITLAVPQDLWEKASEYAWKTYPAGPVWDGRHFCGYLAYHGWVPKDWDDLWNPMMIPLAQWEADASRSRWEWEPIQANAWNTRVGWSYTPR